MKHLTTADIQSLARRLDTMKRQVLDELAGSAPHAMAEVANDTREVHTNAEDAEVEREEDLRLAEVEIDRRRLEDIERAQLHVSQGSYGVCMDCGDEIPLERLFAQPTAVRCAQCQCALEDRKT